MVESVCQSCPLGALCLGAGSSLEEFISRTVTRFIDEFIANGPDAQTGYEQDAVRQTAATQAAQRVHKILEEKIPATCPLLRRHN